MGYRLSFDDPLPRTLHATALELVDDAIATAGDGIAEDPVTGIHEVRKDIKKARSLLRLVRSDIGGKAYQRENRHLRDTARGVSGVRDADVLVETVDKLAARYVGRLPKRAFTTLRRQLARDASGSGEVAGESASEALVAALSETRHRIDSWGLDGCDETTLRAGAVRAYARGRDALADVERERSVEALHEWRKRVKDLWYHQRLLRNAWNAPLKAMAQESHGLADLLGDDHDLAVLAEKAADWPGSAALDNETLLSLIAERRAELQQEALDLGRRVYAEKPKAYDRRLGRYLGVAAVRARTAHVA
jgi:CHAD domain-containing protein